MKQSFEVSTSRLRVKIGSQLSLFDPLPGDQRGDMADALHQREAFKCSEKVCEDNLACPYWPLECF